MRQLSHPPATVPPRPAMPEVLCKASTTPDVVRAPARTALAIEGSAAPGSPEFQAAIEALYSAGYQLKFAQRDRHRDFRVPPLEGRWRAEPAPRSLTAAPPSTWRWELRLGIPSGVTAKEVAQAIAGAAEKKSAAAKIRVVRIPAQTLGRILHVGPWSEEARNLQAAREALAHAGLTPAGPHLEVYVSDPRRVEPARLRTVLLLEAAPAALSS